MVTPSNGDGFRGSRSCLLYPLHAFVFKILRAFDRHPFETKNRNISSQFEQNVYFRR